jgi:tetratricopeptide (TPR) repeat protein
METADMQRSRMRFDATDCRAAVSIRVAGHTIVTMARPVCRRSLVFCAIAFLARTPLAAQEAPDPLANLHAATTAAAAALAAGEQQIAESQYRTALGDGWMLLGALDAADARWDTAAAAFERASRATVQPRAALRSLALVRIYTGNAGDAVQILTRLAGVDRRDLATRRLLAQALAANGQPAEAVQELRETAALAPDDPELKFLLASGYLRITQVDAAERLFAEIRRQRPIPQTDVLIGRTYRDHGEYDRAEASLRAALRKDPRTRRAHYYLGTVAIMREGAVRLDDAIREFRRELAIAPADPVTNLRLGMALVEARRPAEALGPLEIGTRTAAPRAEGFFTLGRCLLALDRAPDAITALRRALDLANASRMGPAQIGGVHYQLAVALRRTGADAESAAEFAEAERLSAQHTEQSRAQLAKYMADTPDEAAVGARPPIRAAFPIASLPQAARTELRRRVTTELAQASFNLGVLHARADRPERAVEFLLDTATLAPEFPRVQYSLGVAYFNAHRYDKAVEPLERALASEPEDAHVRRMLALSLLSAGGAERAAELLRNDPGRDTDPALQYAYGLALLRSGRAGDALIVLSALAASHGDTPELDVVIGQAHARQGAYDEAARALQRAISLKADVPEAHGALGELYLRKGQLPEAAAAFREEVRISPRDLSARHNLATVLDLQGDRDEAVSLLRGVLAADGAYVDARYLLGKILLAQGAADAAAVQLETAVRLQADNANAHYQLAQAYQRLGRTDAAAREFDAYREIKDRSAGRTP